MNEYAALQQLRAEIAEPNPAELERAFARLDLAMREAVVQDSAIRETTAQEAVVPADTPRIARPGGPNRVPQPVPATAHAATRGSRARRRVGWSLGVVGGAVAFALVGGNVAMAVESARTGDLLREIAGATVAFEDPAPGSGEYLRSVTRADWGITTGDEQDPASTEYQPNVQIIDVYMPADPAADWVLVRDWGAGEAVSAGNGSGVHVERIAAPYGNFYGGLGEPNPDAEPAAPPTPESGWLGADPADIPTSSGQDAYDWIDTQYSDGSASRAEDNYERIATLLRTGLMPAPQRAALLEALALVPGVSSTTGVANLDGVKGVAFGRAEALRDGERSEIIIDPDTGLVIGERSLAGLSIFGFETGEVVSSTSIETTVVDGPPAE